MAPGEVVSLAGRNGSGKSTTLRLLAGVLRPDSGEALLDGVPALTTAARRGLGYVAEADDFPGRLTVRQILGYAAVLAGAGPGRARREARIAAEATGLEEWLETPGERCSRGVRRRISLAQALVGEPTALILDEPLTGLDPVARGRAVRVIREAAAAGATIVVSLHDGLTTDALADRLIVLEDGVITAAGPLGELAAIRDGSAGASHNGGDWLACVLDTGAGPS